MAYRELSQTRPTHPRRGGGVAVPISRCRTRHAIAATLAKGSSSTQMRHRRESQSEGKDAEQNVSPHAWSTTFDVAICRNWTSSGGVAWPFRSLPQHSTSPDGRRPQEKALPAWTCTNLPAGGFVQPVSWSSPLRTVAVMAYDATFQRRRAVAVMACSGRRCYSRTRATRAASRHETSSPTKREGKKNGRRTKNQHLTWPSLRNPHVCTAPHDTC